MERFGMNSARSFLGKNVNLHLKDGSVIVNVQLGAIHKDEFKRQRFVTCVPYGNRNTFRIPLKSIAWAELLNLNLIRGGEPSLGTTRLRESEAAPNHKNRALSPTG